MRVYTREKNIFVWKLENMVYIGNCCKRFGNVTGCFVLHIQSNEIVKVVFKCNTVVVLNK